MPKDSDRLKELEDRLIDLQEKEYGQWFEQILVDEEREQEIERLKGQIDFLIKRPAKGSGSPDARKAIAYAEMRWKENKNISQKEMIFEVLDKAGLIVEPEYETVRGWIYKCDPAYKPGKPGRKSKSKVSKSN